jgi:hypothetical protein
MGGVFVVRGSSSRNWARSRVGAPSGPGCGSPRSATARRSSPETQQTPTTGTRISLRIRRTRHFPMDIDGCHIGADEPGVDGCTALVAPHSWAPNSAAVTWVGVLHTPPLRTVTWRSPLVAVAAQHTLPVPSLVQLGSELTVPARLVHVPHVEPLNSLT